jgi:hypothetical protein
MSVAERRQRRTLSFPRVLNWPSHLRARTEQLRTASLQAQLDEALAENKILRQKIEELQNMSWLSERPTAMTVAPSSSTVGATTSSSDEVVVAEIAVRPLGESTAPSAWLAARPLAPLPLVSPGLVPDLVPPPSAPLLLATPPHALPPSAREAAAEAAAAQAAAAQKTAEAKAAAEAAAAQKTAAE